MTTYLPFAWSVRDSGHFVLRCVCAVVRSHTISLPIKTCSLLVYLVGKTLLTKGNGVFSHFACIGELNSPLTTCRHRAFCCASASHGRNTHEWWWSFWGMPNLCARGELAYVWVKYVLVLGSHVLPDSMVTNPSLLPIFPLYLVSSGRDYTGLDSLPEADIHSFIKKPKSSCSHASCLAKMHQLLPDWQHGKSSCLNHVCKIIHAICGCRERLVVSRPLRLCNAAAAAEVMMTSVQESSFSHVGSLPSSLTASSVKH